MFDEIRIWNRKNIKNYFEIYIKCNKKDLIKKNKKKLYKSDKNNIVGKDIIPQYPRDPDLIICNNYKKSIDTISLKIFGKISKRFIF